MKCLFTLFLAFFVSHGMAQENANPFDVQVIATSSDGRFHIQASYSLPINICNAFVFITDYEGSKNVPGIVEAKINLKSGQYSEGI